MELDIGLGAGEAVPGDVEIAGRSEADGDAELARRAARGDADAWDALFDRFCAWAYRFAYAHLAGNHADAQDLCSDILMTAARSIGRYDPRKGDLDAWMHGLARHRLSRFCRKRRIEAPLVPADVPGERQGPGMLGADDMAERACTRDVVARALASLPERQATVLVGKYVDGLSTAELARQASTTPRAIDSLLVRARTAFRSAFKMLVDEAPEERQR